MRHDHWLYIAIPIFTSIVWAGTLLAMIITWAAQGKPHFVTEDGTIPYISDIGADILKPLFITGCSITAVGFFTCLVLERILRHTGRLVPTQRRREKTFGLLAVAGSFLGGLGLILLSIFDTKRHQQAHRAFLLVFIVGVGLSAIFTITEYRWLSKDYPDFYQLRINYLLKFVIATTLIILAVAFAITLYVATNAGAVLEWVIGFGFTFYLLTFWYSLRLVKGVPRGHHTRTSVERLRQPDMRSII